MSPRLLPACFTTALVLSVLSLTDSPARTIHVNASGGGDATSIKTGLSMAIAGDTVLVAPGTYNGPDNRLIGWGGLNKVLMSESGAAATIIDGEDQSGIIYFQQAVDSTSVIRGFTFTHGRSDAGATISITGASPRILDCIFRDNAATVNGGGVWVNIANAPVTVSGCVFINNTAGYRGGGLMADHSTVTVTGCVFRGNSVTTGVVAANYGGGGLQGEGATMLVTGCTFGGNSAAAGPGGILGYAGTITVEKTIVAFSTRGQGVVGATANGCVIFGNAGGDDLGAAGTNILYVDPLFCGAATGDVTLCANSPCLPGSGANPVGQLIGAHGEGCGACSAPVASTTWGGIKALYR